MKASRLTVLAGASALAIIATATPAFAVTELDGTCSAGSGNGEWCAYYYLNTAGSRVDFLFNKPSFVGYTFITNGAGVGQSVMNNATSMQNWDHVRNARVYFNSNYGGTSDYSKAWTWENLVNTFNNNASFKWL